MNRILVLLLIVLLASCGKNTLVEKERIFDNNTWNRFDKLNFEFPVEKENGYYNIKLVVKHDGNFEENQLPVYLILNTSSGEERMKEVSFLLKDKGVLQGEKQENVYSVTKDVWTSIMIADKGKCTVSIENIYPKYDSFGIHSVSLVVEKAEKPKSAEEE